MVNTFLPFPDFPTCASVLDDKRLYKQIVECKQILSILNGEKEGYKNHPAVLMWKGYEQALRYYQWCMFREWGYRRYKFNLMCNFPFRLDELELPSFIGVETFHKSHRLNLLWKEHDHYKTYFTEKTPKTKPPYWWPTKEIKKEND